MRITTVIRRLLAVTSFFVRAIHFESGAMILDVAMTWRRPRCMDCGKIVPGYDQREPRRWRHLGIGRTRIFIQYAPRRVECAQCGIGVEAVPWATGTSRFTTELEEFAAYLAQITDKTAVTKLLGISWRSVGEIVERVVKRRLDPARFDGLERIGVDEFSYRKRHQYLTIVVDHDKRRVIWAEPGATKEIFEAFFEQLGDERARKIRTVTLDMSGPFISAIRAKIPHAKIVFDRFHVQQLVNRALDEVRRSVLRDLRGTGEGEDLFKARFSLLKRADNRNAKDERRIEGVQKTSRSLGRAWQLKEVLVSIFDRKQRHKAKALFHEWLAWASRSKLAPFVRVARTLRKYIEGVLAYFDERETNGFTEGINNHSRVIARRSYGFHYPQSLIFMIFLCCGGIELDPPLP